MKRNPAAWILPALLAATLADQAAAECSNTVQCIGISAVSAADAEGNHHVHSGGTTPGSKLVIMDFGNRPVASSVVRTLYVAAAMSPQIGAVVRLNPIEITGADASQFALVGGSCALRGGDGPRHGADGTGHCTIEVRFNPTSPGAKTAQLRVPFPQPSAGSIDHRDATLSGIGGNDRASPAPDPNVASLIAGQVAAQRRFAAAQLSNISNRLDSLHRAAGLRADPLAFGGAEPLPRGAGLPRTPDGRDTPSRDRQPRIGHDSGASARGDLGPIPELLVSLLRTRELPLMLASDAAGRAGTASGGGYWFSGVARFGRTGSTGSETRFETSGFTLGADRRIGADLLVGGAAGYGRAQDSFQADGSDGRHTGQSLSLYGSYQLQPHLYLDAILGYGTSESRSSRFVVANATRASSEREGSQYFGSLAVSKELHRERLSWAPYARVEFNRGTLDRADESGAGISSLTYREQRHRSSRLSLGVRTSAVHEMAYGRVIPHLRLEYGRELQRVGAASVSYADQPAGPVYAVQPGHERRGSAMLGLGAELLTQAGLTLGFDIGANGRHANDPEYTTRFWLSTALDAGRPLPPGASAAPAAPVRQLFNVSAALRLDDNITRTGSPTPTLSDRIWTVGIGAGDRAEFSDSLNLGYGVQLAAEKFQTHDRLDAAVLGARAELAYQAGGLFTAPRVGIFASAAYDDSRSDLRTGRRLELGLNARVQVAERTGISGVLAHNRRRARGEIFDTDVDAARIGADHQVGERGTLRAGLEYRRGDFVSSGIPAADSAAISDALADDDAFPERRFVAYRFPARSLIASLGYSLSLGSRDAIDIGVSAIRVRPTQEPDYGRFDYLFILSRGQGGKSPYSVRQLEITYTMRF